MSLRSQLGGLRRRALTASHRRVVPLHFQVPIITFTFDDFPRTAFTVGAEILERYGVKATYYVAMSLMNTTNDLGEQFRREDLPELVDRGHEVANHTFSHISARQVGFNAFENDVEKGRLAIRERIGVRASANFAYPYGEATLAAKKKLGRRAMSSRGTYGGLNGPKVDLNLLRANSLYGGLDRADKAKQLIFENENLGGWLIFYSHDVAEKPSPFGCTPQLLEEICSFAVARNARLMTVSQVVDEIERHVIQSPEACNAYGFLNYRF